MANKKLDELLKKPFGEITEADIIAAWEEVIGNLGKFQRADKGSYTSEAGISWKSICGEFSYHANYGRSAFDDPANIQLHIKGFSWRRGGFSEELSYRLANSVHIHIAAKKLGKVPEQLIIEMQKYPDEIDMSALMH